MNGLDGRAPARRSSLGVRVLVLVAIGSGSTLVAAQPSARGPADVITGAREAREANERRASTQRGEAAQEGAAQEGAAQEGAAPEEAAEQASAQHAMRALSEPRVADARSSADVPAGEIWVSVAQPDGSAAPDTSVRLGIMGAEGDRNNRTTTTDAEGRAVFTELTGGSEQSYRVNVLHDGATYSSTPFRLEADQGHLVRILRLPVTRDERVLLQWIGGTFMELKPERVHIVQQTELVNLGRESFVFPEEGLAIPLPQGFMAFQSPAVMTDQRLVPDDEGFRIHGSLPPGRVQLTWAFDLPIRGTEMVFTQPMPVRTYQYVVVSDAAPGLSLEVADFPAAQETESQGRPHLVTRAQRNPNEPPFTEIRVQLRGIPGPGPYRSLAVAAALLLLSFGVFLATRGGGVSRSAVRVRERRRGELLAEARLLEEELAREEVGPGYHERRQREIVDELAILLAMDSTSAQTPGRAEPSKRP